MEEVRIHVVIHSRYQVFDASGRLPFSIVFGLCRHSSADTDLLPLIIDSKQSVFDVPYALATDLLTLHEDTKAGGLEVDLKDLKTEDQSERPYITLPCPAGRTENWRNSFTSVLYRVEPGSDLASRFQNGKAYTMRMTSQDLGVQRWCYGEQEQLANGPQSGKLINQKSTGTGKATFKVVSSLPWPPNVSTRLRILHSTQQGDIHLDISVQNTSDEVITIQTRGFQHYLIPWGPFQPENEASDYRPRIIDTQSGPERPPLSALQVFDLQSGELVYQVPKPTSAPLTEAHDPRPEVDDLVTIKPGETLVRNVDIGRVLEGLPDGKYGVRLAPRGMWWCIGSLEDVIEEGGDRVKKEKFQTVIPPVMLESDDVVEA